MATTRTKPHWWSSVPDGLRQAWSSAKYSRPASTRYTLFSPLTNLPQSSTGKEWKFALHEPGAQLSGDQACELFGRLATSLKVKDWTELRAMTNDDPDYLQNVLEHFAGCVASFDLEASSTASERAAFAKDIRRHAKALMKKMVSAKIHTLGIGALLTIEQAGSASEAFRDGRTFVSEPNESFSLRFAPYMATAGLPTMWELLYSLVDRADDLIANDGRAKLLRNKTGRENPPANKSKSEGKKRLPRDPKRAFVVRGIAEIVRVLEPNSTHLTLIGRIASAALKLDQQLNAQEVRDLLRVTATVQK